MPAPRKPTAIHALTGAMQAHPERFRDRANEPKPEPDNGDAPKWLDQDSEAIWHELQTEVAHGVLTRQDRRAFAMLCCLLAEFQASPTGMQTSRISVMNSLLGQFGMTPATRSKVTAAPDAKPENRFAKNGRHPETANPFAEFATPPKTGNRG